MSRSEDNTCEHCRCDLPRHVVGKVYYCSAECHREAEGMFDCADCGDLLSVDHECPADVPGEHHRDLHGVQCHCDQTPWAYRLPTLDWIVGCDKCPHEPARAPRLADAIALWTGVGRRDDDPPGVAEADATMDSWEARA